MRILVVAAHPDDETLGCGATIARHVEAGDEVRIVVLADGESSREGCTKEKIDRRRAQAAEAAEILGAGLRVLDYADQRLDVVPMAELAAKVAREVQDFDPAVVYTHWPHDLNLDHAAAARATLTACRPGRTSARRILSFEVPSSTECAPVALATPFHADVFVSVEPRHIGHKLRAMCCYADEMRRASIPSERAAWSYMEARGFAAGVPHAEAFALMREVL